MRILHDILFLAFYIISVHYLVSRDLIYLAVVLNVLSVYVILHTMDLDSPRVHNFGFNRRTSTNSFQPIMLADGLPVIRMRSKLPGLQLLDLGALMSVDGNTQQSPEELSAMLTQLQAFFNNIVHPDDLQKFRVQANELGLDIKDLMEIVAKIMSASGGRPTMSSPGTSSGLDKTGPGSTDDPSTMV